MADAIEKGISYLTEDRKKEGLALGLSVEMNIMLGNYPDYAGAAGNVDENAAGSPVRNWWMRCE